ncbi:unnamed protein product [Calicophoron daubneyi]|uniref:C2H2-type domain-containing protein n=1 Tax=Calicophoron daubneyi TaxID=300641 RepID=A0AAV2T980_CALDB
MKLEAQLDLEFSDLKSAFNDIATGHTPTNPFDGGFRDFSKLENLDTPTPLEGADICTYFIYPPTSAGSDQQNMPACCKHEEGVQQPVYITPTQQQPSDQLHPLVYLHVNDDEQAVYSTPDRIIPGLETSTDLISDKHLMVQSQSDSSLSPPQFYTNQSAESPHYGVLRTVTPSGVYPNYDVPPASNCMASCGRLDIKLEDSPQRVPSNTYVPQQPCIATTTVSSSWTNLRTTTSPANPSAFIPSGYKLEHLAQRPNSSFVHPNGDHFSCHPNSRVTLPLPPLPPSTSSSNEKTPKAKPLEKAFACQFPNCIKRFARIDELKRHQRTHSDVKQFVCDICSKGFTRSDHLMTHRRTHTGERPYPCTYCERRFARSDERNRHMKVHLRDRTKPGRRPRTYNRKPKTTPAIFNPLFSLSTSGPYEMDIKEMVASAM